MGAEFQRSSNILIMACMDQAALANDHTVLQDLLDKGGYITAEGYDEVARTCDLRTIQILYGYYQRNPLYDRAFCNQSYDVLKWLKVRNPCIFEYAVAASNPHAIRMVEEGHRVYGDVLEQILRRPKHLNARDGDQVFCWLVRKGYRISELSESRLRGGLMYGVTSEFSTFFSVRMNVRREAKGVKRMSIPRCLRVIIDQYVYQV